MKNFFQEKEVKALKKRFNNKKVQVNHKFIIFSVNFFSEIPLGIFVNKYDFKALNRILTNSGPSFKLYFLTPHRLCKWTNRILTQCMIHIRASEIWPSLIHTLKLFWFGYFIVLFSFISQVIIAIGNSGWNLHSEWERVCTSCSERESSACRPGIHSSIFSMISEIVNSVVHAW